MIIIMLIIIMIMIIMIIIMMIMIITISIILVYHFYTIIDNQTLNFIMNILISVIDNDDNTVIIPGAGAGLRRGREAPAASA